MPPFERNQQPLVSKLYLFNKIAPEVFFLGEDISAPPFSVWAVWDLMQVELDQEASLHP